MLSVVIVHTGASAKLAASTALGEADVYIHMLHMHGHRDGSLSRYKLASAFVTFLGGDGG